VTVHVGDTITWTNNGPSTHTATARDGSFNTGPLKRGQSASHTFTHAGTFAYICQIHPFMHGTIVVLAAPAAAGAPASSGSAAGGSSKASTTPSTAAGSGTGGSSGSATRPPSTPTRAAAQPALPVTGLDLSPGLAIGLVLLGAGVALHRATRERPG
jgi:Cupredoxin-like domain